MRLIALILAALCASAAAQFNPGPTLRAADVGPPPAGRSWSVSATVNGRASSVPCVVLKIGAAYCPACDLSELDDLGRLELRMILSDGVRTSDPSAPHVVDVTRDACSTPDSGGVIRCVKRFATSAAGPLGACAPSTPAAVYVVSPNGAATTREAFELVDGKRSIASTGTAAVGSTCDCSRAEVLELGGLARFCAVSPPGAARTMVAACRVAR